MAVATLPSRLMAHRLGRAARIGLGLAVLAAIGLVIAGSARLFAQIEGDRGIAPVAVTNDIEVGGIDVNVTGKSADEARNSGWAEARRKAWIKLGGSAMPDGQLDSLVSAIVVEQEQIGPRRYIARLGVVFDRARAGQYVGTGDGGPATHSAPMLTVPVLYSGGTAQVYEVRGPWQNAWAQFKAGSSGIDYVRPSGGGGDSLLMNAGQTGRRSRSWWSNILSSFNASDTLFPIARLERQWPGGPIRGTFTARYGPDNNFLGSFTLNANDEAALPAMLNEAVKRIDRLYNDALSKGMLRPDPTLNAQPVLDPALAALIAAAVKADAAASPTDSPTAGTTPGAVTSPSPPTPTPTVEAKVTAITVQFASPDARAVDSALSSVRSVPGVRGASTTSLAMGGTSVMRVSFAGSLEDLRDALRARGWSVSAGSNALSIRR